MVARAFTSFAAHVALVAAATALVATAASTTDAFKPAVGGTCECAMAATAGKCIVFTSFTNAAKTRGTCQTVGNKCVVPWECTDDGPTHMCAAHAVESTLRCTEPASGGGCPCQKKKTDDVTLRPTQVLPAGGGGSGGQGRGKEVKAEPKSTTEKEENAVKGNPAPAPWSPSGPAPAPKSPACKATHAIVSVEGKPWRCVQSTDIGKRSAEEAYDYRKWVNNGWETKDDYINLNFMSDAASRLYLCVTYGSAAKSDVPIIRRSVAASLVSAAPNNFYFQDDPMTFDADGKRKGDLYVPMDGSSSTALAAKHSWMDEMTDGYCVDAAEGLVANFTGLAYVKGLALSEGGAAAGYPDTGAWAFWKLAAKPTTAALAYDHAGRILKIEEQKAAWAGQLGVLPPSAIHRVTMDAACSCDGWRATAKAAAAKAME